MKTSTIVLRISQYPESDEHCVHFQSNIRMRFLPLARGKLILCLANHRAGYWSNLPCKWLSTAYAVFRPIELAPHINNGSTDRHCSGLVGILHNMRMQKKTERPRLLIQNLCTMRGPISCQAYSFWTTTLLSEAAFIACDENIIIFGLVGKVSTHATKV